MAAYSAQDDNRWATSTPFSEASRGNSCTPSALSIDPRAATPLLRYGARSYTPRGAPLSSRTPTPQQWAREYALRGDAETPKRCSTAIGFQTSAVPETMRPWSVADEITRPQSVGGFADQQKDSESLSLRELPVDQSDDKQWKSEGASSEAFRSKGAGCYGEIFRSHSSSEDCLDDLRPVRSRPVMPLKKDSSMRQRAIMSEQLERGGRLNSVQKRQWYPLTPPPKMSPPTVHPINAWRTRVEWVPAAGSYEDPECSYSLTCFSSDSENTLTIDSLGNVPHAYFDHLAPGSTLFFKVRACNSEGFGEWSNPSTGYIAPKPPRKLSNAENHLKDLSYSDSSNSATLEWDEPCNHGAQITGYNVQYSLNPADPYSIETVACFSRRTSIEVTELMPNSIYFFRTQAVNDVGESNWTDWSQGVATTALGPERPPPPTLVQARPTELFIQWERPRSCGFRITEYTVQISEQPTMREACILPVLQTPKKPKPVYVGERVWVTSDESLLNKSCRMSPICSRLTGQQRQSKLGAEGVVLEIDGKHSLAKLSRGIDWVPVKALERAKETQESLDDDSTLHVTDLSPHTCYYFQVMAKTEIGNSPWSETSEPFRTEPSLPGACTNVRVVKNEYEKVEIEWTAPESFGAPLESFLIRYRDAVHPKKERNRIEALADDRSRQAGAASSKWVEGMEPGSRVIFEVAARSSAGLGPFSEASEEIICLPGIPGRPPQPMVTARTKTSMLVQVDDRTEKHGTEIIGYECRYSTQSSMHNSIDIVGLMKEGERQHPDLPRIFETVATRLTYRGPYYFSVRAVTKVGKSPWSNPSEAMLLIVDAPTQMTAPHLVESELDGLIVGYTPAADLGVTMGGGMIEYEMRYSRWKDLLETCSSNRELDFLSKPHEDVSARQWVAPKLLKNEKGLQVPPPQHIEGLLTGRSYYFQIRSISNNGAGPWSYISSPFEVLPSRPETPQAPAVAIGNESPYCIRTSITLPEHNGRDIDRCRLWIYGPWWDDQVGIEEWRDLYEIELIDVQEERLQRSCIKDASEPSLVGIWHHSVINLEAGAYYKFKCACRNSIGWSECSDESAPLATLPTFPDQCKPPVLASEDERTFHSLTLVWTAPHSGGAALSHYTLLWANNPRFQDPITIDSVAEPCLTLDNLEPYQWYYFKVAAVNTIGRGKFSDYDTTQNIGCFLTKATVPGPVQDLSVRLTKDDDVQVKWNRPLKSGGHIISRYKLIASRIGTMDKIDFEHDCKAHRECRLHDLHPDTSYFFEVVAANSVGFGPPTSAPCFIQTKPPPPATSIKAILPPPVVVLTCEIRSDDTGAASLHTFWSNPELYDKKKGFIFKAGSQTHMILKYNVKIVVGDPVVEALDVVASYEGVPQVRDRRTVPKDEHNNVSFNTLLPGRYYSAMVQSESEVGVSPWSAICEGVRSPAAKPDDPTFLHLVDCFLDTITLEWTCPHGNGAEVTGFNLWFRRKASTADRKLRFTKACQELAEGRLKLADSSLAVVASKTEKVSIEVGNDENFRRASLTSAISAAQLAAALEDEDDENSESGTDAEPKAPEEQNAAYEFVCIDFENCKVGDDEDDDLADEYAPLGGLHAGRTCRWVIKGLQCGVFFGAHVQAINAVGVSHKIHSDLLRTASNIPDPPSHCRVIPGVATTTSIAFTWEPPEEDGGEEVLGYQVAWMRMLYLESPPTHIGQIFENSERVDLPASPCKYEVTGLLPGDSVAPVVRCWNAVGFSQWCRMLDPHEIRTFATLPAAPSPIRIPPRLEKAESRDYKPYSLTASWKCPHLNGWPIKYFLLSIQLGGDPPAKSEDGPGITKKELRVDHDNSSVDWVEGDHVSLTFVHEGLIPGAPYILNVRPGTGDATVGDCEDWGATSQPELAPPDKPLQPLSPTCPWQWPDALQVVWVEPCMRGAPLTTAEMCFSLDSDMGNLINLKKKEEIQKIVEKKEIIIGNLNYTTAYYFQMRIANEVGWSPWSDVSVAFVTKACRPAHPDALVPIDVMKENFSMRWFPPSDHGAKITEYEIIMVDTRQCEDFDELVHQANQCNYVDGDDFDAEKADQAVWEVLKKVSLKASARIKVEEAQDPEAPTYTFTELFGGIVYSAAVRAYNSEGWSDFSPVLSVETPSARPEQCPQLSLLEATQTSLQMQYRAPYDNGAPLQSFEISWKHVVGPKDRYNARMFGAEVYEHADHASGTIHIDVTNKMSTGDKGEALLEGLEPGTDYEAQVCAANKHGNGLQSHVIRMQTAPGRPDAPTDIRHSRSAKSLHQDPTAQRRQLQDEGQNVVAFSQTSMLQASEVVHMRHGSAK